MLQDNSKQINSIDIIIVMIFIFGKKDLIKEIIKSNAVLPNFYKSITWKQFHLGSVLASVIGFGVTSKLACRCNTAFKISLKYRLAISPDL